MFVIYNHNCQHCCNFLHLYTPQYHSHLYGIIHTYPPIYYQWDETSTSFQHKYQWHELVVARNVHKPWFIMQKLQSFQTLRRIDCNVKKPWCIFNKNEFSNVDFNHICEEFILIRENYHCHSFACVRIQRVSEKSTQ